MQKTTSRKECSLCSKIWSSKETYQKFMLSADLYEKIAIVRENGNPYLYIPIEDCYYSDTYVKTNFCPNCGKKLKCEVVKTL